MTLTRQLISLCFLHNTPNNLSVSQQQLYKTTVIYFLFSIALDDLFVEFSDGIVQTSLDLILALFIISTVFLIKETDKKYQRFLQTMTSILGCQTVLTVLALPIGYWIALTDEKYIWIPVYCLPLLIFWNITVVGHILSEELNKTIWQGIIFSILFFSGSFLISTLVTVV